MLSRTKPNYCSPFSGNSVYRMTISVTMQPLKHQDWLMFQTTTLFWLGQTIKSDIFISSVA